MFAREGVWEVCGRRPFRGEPDRGSVVRVRRGPGEEPPTTAVSPPVEVRLCWGDVVVPVVPAAMSGGAFGCVRVTVEPPARRPTYIDHAADEIVSVLSGSFAVTIGDADPVRLEAGGVVLVPRGQPRRVDVVGGSAGTLLVMATPGDQLDDLLVELRVGTPDRRALARCGIEILPAT